MATAATLSDNSQQELLRFLTQPETVVKFVDECTDLGQKVNAIGINFNQVRHGFAGIIKKYGKDFPDVEKVYSPKWDGLIDHFKRVLESSWELTVKTEAALRDYGMNLGFFEDTETQEDLNDIQQNLQKYVREHPAGMATTVTDGFKDLRNDAQRFSEDFSKYVIKQGQVYTEEAKGYSEDIKTHQAEIDELNDEIKKILIALDSNYLFAFVIPSLSVPVGPALPNIIARGKAQDNLNITQAKLKRVTDEQKPLVVVQADIEVLKPDIDNICTKLAAIASIWALLTEKMTWVSAALDEGMSVIKKKTFQVKINLLRAQVDPLREGIMRYIILTREE